jgi:hypothetical protein
MKTARTTDDTTAPKNVVELHAEKVLAVLAVTIAVVEILIAIAAWLARHQMPVRETLVFGEFAWRGAWMGILFLWGIGATPWRPAGGHLALVLLFGLALLSIPLATTRAFDRAEQGWSLVYGAAIAAWLVAARLFGVRLGHHLRLQQPQRLRWSLLTIIAAVTLAAIVAGIGTAIWRSWLYEREHSTGWLVGLLQVLLMLLMTTTSFQSVFLLGALRWRWGSYASVAVGLLCMGIILYSRWRGESTGVIWRGELAGAVFFGGCSLLSNGILAAVVHYCGWRIFLDTPVWDRQGAARIHSA